MNSQPADPQQGTVDALLASAGRSTNSVPLRTTFVQQGSQRHPRPGPLHYLVRAHDERALDLFLLHRALASSEPWDVTRDSRVWARTLGLPTPKDTGAAAVSKTWARLDTKYNLVRRGRRGRIAAVTALCEDGSGDAYTHPARRYFRLPFAYWMADDAWYVNLDLASKAVLLIAHSLRPPFILPTEKARPWYGLSTDTVERGLRSLREAGLLLRETRSRPDWLTPIGVKKEFIYTLQPPFSRAQHADTNEEQSETETEQEAT